ncbi:hypothetical protein OCU04_011641 [Sclerotinia nivalis]|uniref:Uncharacterized protein n=1 Tax=Sclerotinia nivalis TaxID=352851 RepID=A0A9X0DEZ5_9HELO|nr:hypothetical protein OCU04_011641 [Sclerotinia nivalis]
MSLSNLISEWFFFYPTLPSFATFVLAARWILHAGPPPNTVKQDLIWLLPIETSLVYNTIALIFLSAYYTEEYVNCHLDIEHLLRLSVHKVACALNLTLVLGYPIWSGLKATTVIVEPLSNPAGVYSWYIFAMYALAALVVFFGIMAIVWLGSGVFGDLKKYKKGGANYLATAQTLEKSDWLGEWQDDVIFDGMKP